MTLEQLEHRIASLEREVARLRREMGVPGSPPWVSPKPLFESEEERVKFMKVIYEYREQLDREMEEYERQQKAECAVREGPSPCHVVEVNRDG